MNCGSERITLLPVSSIGKYLISLIFFFSWFESFALVNIASIDWGLQVSWFFLFIFAFIEFFCIVSNKYTLVQFSFYRAEFKFIFLCFILITIIDWIHLSINPENIVYSGTLTFSSFTKSYSPHDLFSRSFFHTVYIVFLFVGALFVFYYLRQKRYSNTLHLIKKYFIEMPFWFIGIWGIYQWLSTYDLFPYSRILNNNVSTGFTYLRFKWEHRCSSVFPEPSEYAYYLAFYLPIVMSYFFKGTNLFSSKATQKKRMTVMLFYLFQCYLCRSFSLFAIFPIILFVTIIKMDISLKLKKLLQLSYLLMMIIFGILTIVIFGDRFMSIIKGTDSSMLVRLAVFFDGLLLFFNRKLFGYGYGCIRGMDLISATLGFFGIIGAAFFVLYLIKLNNKSSKNSYASLLFLSYLCFILTGCISNPLFEFLPFWLVPALIETLSLYDEQQIGKK